METTSSIEYKPDVNYYVAALYCNKWYIGKCVTIDENEMEVEISFMETKKTLFQCPRHPDIVWVKFSEIIRKIKVPVLLRMTTPSSMAASQFKYNT